MQDISDDTKKLRKSYFDLFDPHKFIEDYFTVVSKQIETTLLMPYNAIKKYYEEDFKTKDKKLRLLDFGCGPVPLYVAASIATDVPLEVVMSEFLPQNREFLTKWKNGEDNQTFEKFFETISKFSEKGLDELKKKTRESIMKIECYDLFNDLSKDYDKYDIILTSYCLEGASTSQAEYEDHMKKVVGLLKKGGLLVMNGMLNETTYTAGKAVLNVFPLKEKVVLELLPSLGLQILSMQKFSKENFPDQPAEFDGSFTLSAKKRD